MTDFTRITDIHDHGTVVSVWLEGSRAPLVFDHRPFAHLVVARTGAINPEALIGQHARATLHDGVLAIEFEEEVD